MTYLKSYKKLQWFSLHFSMWVACFALQHGFAQVINERPNVIIILADDLGYGDVSTYNKNSIFSTPKIDTLAINRA